MSKGEVGEDGEVVLAPKEKRVTKTGLYLRRYGVKDILGVKEVLENYSSDKQHQIPKNGNQPHHPHQPHPYSYRPGIFMIV